MRTFQYVDLVYGLFYFNGNDEIRVFDRFEGAMYKCFIEIKNKTFAALEARLLRRK